MKAKITKIKKPIFTEDFIVFLKGCLVVAKSLLGIIILLTIFFPLVIIFGLLWIITFGYITWIELFIDWWISLFPKFTASGYID